MVLNWFKKKYQIKCCDPFSKHKKPVRAVLCIVSVELTDFLMNRTNAGVKPAMKLCPRCHSEAANNLAESSTEVEQSDFEVGTEDICLEMGSTRFYIHRWVTSMGHLNLIQVASEEWHLLSAFHTHLHWDSCNRYRKPGTLIQDQQKKVLEVLNVKF